MPELENIRVDKVLTNISIKYANAAFVGTQLLPVVPVKKRSDIYYIYDSRGDRLRIPKTLRAPKSESRTVDWKVTNEPYICKEYALNDLIDDTERDNADKPLNLEVDTTEFLTDIMGLSLEMRIKKKLDGLGGTAPTIKWDIYDQATPAEDSDPMADIDIGKAAIHKVIFKEPNVLLLPKPVFEVLKRHPKIIELIKYVQKGVATADLLASLFGIEKVVIGAAGYNTTKEGKAAVLDYLWGEDVILAYVEPRPGIKKFSLGYTFQSKKRQTRRARIETKHSDWIEVSEIETEELVCPACGYRIPTALTVE